MLGKMAFVIKTKDMTEEEYLREKMDYIAMVEEKQRKNKEYQKAYRDKKASNLQSTLPNPDIPEQCEVCGTKINGQAQWINHQQTKIHKWNASPKPEKHEYPRNCQTCGTIITCESHRLTHEKTKKHRRLTLHHLNSHIPGL